MERIVGYDLDGTLRACDMPVLRCMHQLHKEGDYDLYKWFYGTQGAPIRWPQEYLRPGLDSAYILTCQPIYAIDQTKQWLAHWLPSIPYEVFPFDPVKPKEWDDQAKNGTCDVTHRWAEWKAERIRALGIKVYFEDGPDIVAKLIELVGDVCQVIQVGGRLV